MSATPGFFESDPRAVNIILDAAARRAPALADTDAANLATIKSSLANLTLAGEALDSAQATNTAAPGTSGTFLQTLISLIEYAVANLPTLLSEIMALIGLVIPVSAAKK